MRRWQWPLGVVVCALLAMGLGLAWGAPLAQGRAGGPVPPLVQALDGNGDGVISADEIAAAPTVLAELDSDGDGSLSRQELFPARGRRPFAPTWRRGFAAGRGFGAGWRFSRGLGGPWMRGGGPWASRFAWRAGRPWLGGFHAGRMARGRPGMEQERGPQGRGPGGWMIDRMFERLDPDGTGFLTPDAVSEQVWQRLAAADTDGDGRISREEMESYVTARREQARQDTPQQQPQSQQ